MQPRSSSTSEETSQRSNLPTPPGKSGGRTSVRTSRFNADTCEPGAHERTRACFADWSSMWRTVHYISHALGQKRAVRAANIPIRQSAGVTQYSAVQCTRTAQHCVAQHITGPYSTLQYSPTMPICTRTCHRHTRLQHDVTAAATRLGGW